MLAKNGIVHVQLTRGLTAIIDAEDIAIISGRRWFAMPDPTRPGKFYAGSGRIDSGEPKTVMMHRLLLGAPACLQVDHRDNDGLNNRRSNLRTCTQAQNQWNAARYRRRCSSSFKGVNLHRGRWIARFMQNGKRINVGSFSSEIEAAAAYNEAVKQLRGEFAVLNRIPGLSV